MQKFTYFQTLGESILHNNNLSWENVKKLKSELIPQKSTLDIFEMKRFYSFFKDLNK